MDMEWNGMVDTVCWMGWLEYITQYTDVYTLCTDTRYEHNHALQWLYTLCCAMLKTEYT